MKPPHILLALMLPTYAFAATLASDARDSAAAFVATQNFVVGRLGRDCLEILSRPETPREFQQTWQRSNAEYHAASTAYIEARLAEIEDLAERDALEQSYYASVNGRGAAAANQILSKGEKEDVCRSAIALVDNGQMNIDEFVENTNQPVKPSLDELLNWARKHKPAR